MVLRARNGHLLINAAHHLVLARPYALHPILLAATGFGQITGGPECGECEAFGELLTRANFNLDYWMNDQFIPPGSEDYRLCYSGGEWSAEYNPALNQMSAVVHCGDDAPGGQDVWIEMDDWSIKLDADRSQGAVWIRFGVYPHNNPSPLCYPVDVAFQFDFRFEKLCRCNTYGASIAGSFLPIAAAGHWSGFQPTTEGLDLAAALANAAITATNGLAGFEDCAPLQIGWSKCGLSDSITAAFSESGICAGGTSVGWSGSGAHTMLDVAFDYATGKYSAMLQIDYTGECAVGGRTCAYWCSCMGMATGLSSLNGAAIDLSCFSMANYTDDPYEECSCEGFDCGCLDGEITLNTGA